MPSIPLKHKCLSIILIWAIVSHIKVVVVSKKSKKKKKKHFFFLLFLIGKKTDMVLGKKVAIFDWECGRNSAPREGRKIPWSILLSFIS